MKKISIIIILACLALIFFWLIKIVFISQSGDGRTELFTVTDGDNTHRISINLRKAGLVDNAFVFETYLKLVKRHGKISAGDYSIYDKWSINKLANALISGSASSNETSIKILEGWNLRDIAKYLEEQKICTAEEFYDAAGKPMVNYALNKNYKKPVDLSGDYSILNNKSANYGYEGFLFPDTYRIFKDATPEDIIKKMVANFQNKIDSQILQDIKSQGKNLYEVITLASIIEKEAKTHEDKQRVAGVYYNRLKIGMPLQADPTVNYVTGQTTDRPTYDQIAVNNLYNTYKYKGLPPGPICNPGLDSIKAAVYPENNSYYYFLNTADGKLIFAKTLEGHKNNRLKYLSD